MAKKRQKHSLNADTRLNLTIGLTSYLSDRKSSTLQELADHFDVPLSEIELGISAMFCATVADSEEQWAMALNDNWREDGVVELQSQMILEGQPRISARQATALASGLAVLAGVASDEDRGEIEGLIAVLGQGTVKAAGSSVTILPGTIDADFAKMRQAIASQKRVSFEYFSNKDVTTQREIDPVQLISNDNEWHVRGFCHLRNEIRDFKLERMRKSEVLETPWGEQAHELELSEELYEAAEDDIKVVVEVTPEAYDLIGNYNAEILSSSGLNDEIKRVEMKIGYLPSLGKLIAKYGGAAKVISPPAAREIVRDYALKALGRKPLETA